MPLSVVEFCFPSIKSFPGFQAQVTEKLEDMFRQFPQIQLSWCTKSDCAELQKISWGHLESEVTSQKRFLYVVCGKQVSLCPNGLMFVWIRYFPSTWYVWMCQIIILIFGISHTESVMHTYYKISTVSHRQWKLLD